MERTGATYGVPALDRGIKPRASYDSQVNWECGPETKVLTPKWSNSGLQVNQVSRVWVAAETVSLPLQGGGSAYPPSHPNFPRPTVGPRGSAYRQMRDSTPEMEAEESVLTTRRGSRGGDQPGLIAHRTLLPAGRPGGRRVERGHMDPGRVPSCPTSTQDVYLQQQYGYLTVEVGLSTRELLATSAHSFLVPASRFPSPTQNAVHRLTGPTPNPRCHLPLVDESPPNTAQRDTHSGKGAWTARTTPTLTSANEEGDCGMKKKDQTRRQKI